MVSFFGLNDNKQAIESLPNSVEKIIFYNLKVKIDDLPSTVKV